MEEWERKNDWNEQKEVFKSLQGGSLMANRVFVVIKAV